MGSEWFQRVRAQAVELWGRMNGLARGASVGLVALLVIAGVLAGRSPSAEYVPLTSQALDGNDLKAVVAQLADMKVPYKLAGDGITIVIPSDQILNARIALAQAGVPRAGADLGIFEQSDVWKTQFEKQVLLLRAMEGELNRAITSMSEVQQATVKLAIPEKSVFLRQQKPVTAAVMVAPRPGRELSSRQVEGIVQFVARSVPELDPDRVIVVDAGGQLLWNGRQDDGGRGPSATDRLAVEMQYRREFETRLLRALEKPFGVGNVAVMVNVEMDFTTATETTQSFSQIGSDGKPVMVSSEDIRETTESTTGAVGDPAGVTANTPTAPTYPGAQSGSGTSTVERRTQRTNFAPTQKYTVETRAPGRVLDKSVSVWINAENLTPEHTAAIKQAAVTAIGAEADKVTVAALPWNTTLLDAFTATAAEAPTGLTLTATEALAAGTVAAALLALLLVLWMRRRRQPQLVLETAGGIPVTVPAAAADDGESDLASLELLLGEDYATLRAEEAHRHRLRTEVTKLAENSPEAVAALVKLWLEEDTYR